MQVRLFDDEGDVAREGARLVAGWLAAHPTGTVLPATGNSPMALYGELAALRERGVFDPGGLRVAQLDEYVGVPDDDPRSLFGWLRCSFAEPLGIGDERIVRLPGDAPDDAGLATACRAFDEAIAAAGGIDVAILGLGPNGHLGFNEPPSPPDAPTRVVELSEASLASSAGYWSGGPAVVPRRALTAGMGWLLGAGHVLLVVTGARKRNILRRMLVEPVDPALPGSLLRTVPSAVLLADRAAWPAELPPPAEGDDGAATRPIPGMASSGG